MKSAASALDYRELARRRLPPFLFEYIDGGSYDEVTLAANRNDLLKVQLRQRVMRDISKLDLSTRLFGQDLAMPVMLGPIGLAGMNARRGRFRRPVPLRTREFHLPCPRSPPVALRRWLEP